LEKERTEDKRKGVEYLNDQKMGFLSVIILMMMKKIWWLRKMEI